MTDKPERVLTCRSHMISSEAAPHDVSFAGVVVVHAAVNGGMITNFGRIFARKLVEQKADLHVFASKYAVFGWPPPVEDIRRLGARYQGLALPEHFAPVREFWTILDMAVRLRTIGAQVLHTRGSVMGFVGRVAGFLAGVPIVLHHQDDLVARDARLKPRSRRLAASVECALSRLCDRTLFVSEAVLEAAVEAGFEREACILVGNDLSEVFQRAAVERPPDTEVVRERLRCLGIRDGTKLVGSIGRLAHIKGIDLLIAAAEKVFPRFPDWAMVIKGDGPLRDVYRDSVRRANLEGRIFLLTEELCQEELPALYRCFDIFALPTRREGFGMVFAEALAMGLPVISPRISPVTEVVPEECGRRIEPESVDSLAAALSDLMGDPCAREVLAAKGKDYAVKTWCGHATSAEKVLKVYAALLREKGIQVSGTRHEGGGRG